jgi:hypothetical protein
MSKFQRGNPAMSKGKVVALVLAICGCLGVLAVIGCGGLLYLGYRTANDSVSPTIDQLFAAIESGSFADTYETKTTPEFQSVTSKEQYGEIGQAISARLGKLKSKSLRGFNMRQHNADSLVDVTYGAAFEKGEGTIVAQLKRNAGEWKIVSFRVNSPIFQQDMATQRCAKCGAPHAKAARFCPACGAKIDVEPAEADPTSPPSVPDGK